MRLLCVLLPAAVLLACGAAPSLQAADGPADRRVYLVSHGWHTGLVIPAGDIGPGAWPVAKGLLQATFIEVGWGDRVYYMKPDAGLATAARAALIGGPGVLHLVGLHDTPQRVFPGSEVVALPITAGGLDRLIGTIADSFERDAAGSAFDLGAALYGSGRFYASHERFHLFRTCNVWVAQALQAAGLPIASSLSADGLVDAARRLVARSGRYGLDNEALRSAVRPDPSSAYTASDGFTADGE